ncbi:phosphatase PAP2 family protein [Polymorphobacter fuscus]|uniref:Phosphatase PAP2 family protein n=1 Tax=Sandarakinorhabdus fusca TaxID=1439888 RepID=A0A7C9KYC1_9SPHN|nr:phosphatase PAP2 family protein [Polymorphobacter fuscus]KAB7643651.1 phosphatase PAP2 family protein [Polymorphobacter fuscus]MQT18725.1 phosphatase PAP2 family protein [Polymorphobacter fuscus]NJC09615.1 undecaprenyl-diphosphatase [Polymorphobacter fuscus]
MSKRLFPRQGRDAGAEIGVALGLGTASVIALLFLWLGREVRTGETTRFDTAIMLALRHADDLASPIGPRWLERTMVDLTALGGVTLLTLVTLIVMGFLLTQRKYAEAAFVGIAIGGGALLGSLLKASYARTRPSLVAHLVEVNSASFPSAHAMNSAITYLTLGVLVARAASTHREKAYAMWVALLLTLVVGVSRVYLGVHWPTDVIAGWAVGSAWAVTCWIIAERVRAPSVAR